MRIVNLTEFLELPSGTIFNKYIPLGFGTLCIKGASCIQRNDFFYTEIPCPNFEDTTEYVSLCSKAEADPNFSIPLDFETTGRDGIYDHTQRFAVWEKQDIEGLIAVLNSATRV